MLVWIVNERTDGQEGFLFGGVFSTKEKAEEVANRENNRKGKPANKWFDYVSVQIDDDFNRYRPI